MLGGHATVLPIAVRADTPKSASNRPLTDLRAADWQEYTCGF